MSVTEYSPSSGDGQLNALRAELASLTTEAVDATHRDLDLLSTTELFEVMNEQNMLVPAALSAASPAVVQAVDAITERMRRGGRLIYVGAVTSGRLGVLDASECPPTFGIDPSRVVGLIAGGDHALRHPIEAIEDSEALGREAVDEIEIGPDDALVGIAASGRTPFVIGALNRGNEAEALTIAVSCNAHSSIGQISDIAIEVVVGPEFIAGSTRLKSGSAQKLVLNMLSTLTMVRLGKTYGNIMIDLQATNDKLRVRAERAVTAVTGCSSPEVGAALAAAGGSAKVATLMLLADLPSDVATQRLEAAGGLLRAALAEDGTV